MKKKIVGTIAVIIMICQAGFGQNDYNFEKVPYDKVTKCNFNQVKKRLKKKRAFIADFVLKQTTALAASAQGFGGAGGGSSKASLALALSGVDEAKYQQMVNELYAQVKIELEAQGFELITDETAKAAFTKMEFGDKIIAENIGGTPKLLDKGGFALAEFRPANKLIITRDQQGLNQVATAMEAMTDLKIGKQMEKELDAVIINIEYSIGIAAIEANSSYMTSISNVKAWPMLIISQNARVYGEKGTMGACITTKPIEGINYWVQNLEKKGKIKVVSNAGSQGYFGWKRTESNTPIIATEELFLKEVRGVIGKLNEKFTAGIKAATLK